MSCESKIEKIITILRKDIEIDLYSKSIDPFKVLISTVLSQRTKDENSALASERLFRKFKNAEQISKASLKEIEKLIRPSGFYRVKARRAKEISKEIVERFGGKTPDTFEELMTLPGVGRKTGGCVLVYGFRKPQIPVDIHCHRVPNRIGLLNTKTPEETEMELMKTVPKKNWIEFNELFVKFGQRICKPIKPLCNKCPIEKLCKYPNKNLK